MLTVISWYAARKSRRPLHELVERVLGQRPTLIAIVTDQYTSDASIRPFARLAERFEGRMDVVLAAEWPQVDRLQDGEQLLNKLGLAREARPRMLTDEGKRRSAMVVRQKQPIALIDLFFEERARLEPPDGRELELRALEEEAVRKLDELLVRLPTQPPPPPRMLQPGEHDFTPQGLCRQCGQGRSTLSICPGTKKDEGPRKDRFELIELD